MLGTLKHMCPSPQQTALIREMQSSAQVAHKRLMPFPQNKKELKLITNTEQGLTPSNKLCLSTCEEDSPCRHEIVFELSSYVNSRRQGLL